MPPKKTKPQPPLKLQSIEAVKREDIPPKILEELGIDTETFLPTCFIPISASTSVVADLQEDFLRKFLEDKERSDISKIDGNETFKVMVVSKFEGDLEKLEKKSGHNHSCLMNMSLLTYASIIPKSCFYEKVLSATDLIPVDAAWGLVILMADGEEKALSKLQQFFSHFESKGVTDFSFISQKDFRGRNLFHYAASLGCVEIFQLFQAKTAGVGLDEKVGLASPAGGAGTAECLFYDGFNVLDLAIESVGSFLLGQKTGLSNRFWLDSDFYRYVMLIQYLKQAGFKPNFKFSAEAFLEKTDAVVVQLRAEAEECVHEAHRVIKEAEEHAKEIVKAAEARAKESAEADKCIAALLLTDSSSSKKTASKKDLAESKKLLASARGDISRLQAELEKERQGSRHLSMNLEKIQRENEKLKADLAQAQEGLLTKEALASRNLQLSKEKEVLEKKIKDLNLELERTKQALSKASLLSPPKSRLASLFSHAEEEIDEAGDKEAMNVCFGGK